MTLSSRKTDSGADWSAFLDFSAPAPVNIGFLGKDFAPAPTFKGVTPVEIRRSAPVRSERSGAFKNYWLLLRENETGSKNNNENRRSIGCFTLLSHFTSLLLLAAAYRRMMWRLLHNLHISDFSLQMVDHKNFYFIRYNSTYFRLS